MQVQDSLLLVSPKASVFHLFPVSTDEHGLHTLYREYYISFPGRPLIP